MPPRTLRSHRPAFTRVTFIVVMVLALVGLLVWKVSIQYGLIPANHPMASSAKGKVMTSAVTVGLGSLAIAGGIGAACYFLSRRSANAALLGMAITMTLPVMAIGYQLYNYSVNGPAPKAASTPGMPPPNIASTPRPPNPGNSSAISMAERARQDMEKNMQALTELARGAKPATGAPAGSPPANPAPMPAAPATPVATSKPKNQTDPNVQKLLDELREGVNGQIAQAIAALEPALTAIAKAPRADLADLRKRAALVKTAREALAPLPDRLRALTDEAKAAAEKGGSESSLRDAIEFSNGFSSPQRAFAADQLIRLLDQGASEAQRLIDNYGRWKVNKEGQIESKDFQLQSGANSDRFFINSTVNTRADTIRKLKGE